jgi:hypothetical protein
MKWVTHRGVKLDRTASAWLILRFIDSEAEFDYVAKEDMPAAIEQGAQPFHNYVFTGTPRQHSGFQELLFEHGLDKTDPALVLLGETVRSAERSGWSKNGCEHEGLWAIANGVNALTSSDTEMVERLLPVYDALYAYCRQRVEGRGGWTSDV